MLATVSSSDASDTSFQTFACWDRSPQVNASSTSRNKTGSEWSFAGAHTVDGAFNGLAASGKDVVVRGYTIMSAEPVDKGDGTDFKVRRYVDWAGLYGQLGLSINWRVPVAAPPRKR